MSSNCCCGWTILVGALVLPLVVAAMLLVLAIGLSLALAVWLADELSTALAARRRRRVQEKAVLR